MKKIIYMRPDGGLSVVHPIRNTHGETLKTDEEIEQRAWNKLPTDAINPQWVDESVIPTDRTFRNAWKAVSGTVVHDMPKALSIAQDKVREARAPKLAALDVEFMRAVETGDTAKQAQVAAQKQRLRDATSDPRLSQAPNANVLKAAMQAVISEL